RAVGHSINAGAAGRGNGRIQASRWLLLGSTGWVMRRRLFAVEGGPDYPRCVPAGRFRAGGLARKTPDPLGSRYLVAIARLFDMAHKPACTI
ncbi:MAG: hypothetical protein WB678_15160, partial [Stellaceae bacterium]